METRIKILLLVFIYANIECRLYELDEEDDTIHIIDRRSLNKNIRKKRNTLPHIPESEGYYPNGTAKDFDVPGVKSKYVFKYDSNNFAFIYWKSADTSIIFIITCQEANTTNYNKINSKGCLSKSNFYRSEDHGASYTPIFKKFKDAFVHGLYVSRLDNNFRIATDFQNKSIYISEDEGMNFKTYKVEFSPTFIHFHPTLKTHIAAFDSTKKNSLYISEDSGITWKFVHDNVRSYFWAQEGYDDINTTIYLEVIGQGLNPDSSSALYRTQSPYSPYGIKRFLTDILIVPFSVYVDKEFIVAQFMTDKKIYVSYNRLDFHVLRYDTLTKIHLHHVILKNENHELMLGIIHPNTTFSLYLTDAFGRKAICLQTDIIMEEVKTISLVPKLDFYQVRGLKSTYIVNKKEGTLISFNKGHTWQHVKGINQDSIGRPIKKGCGSTCNLVLHLKVDKSLTEFNAPILSKESAPGIIIAQGYLEDMSDAIGVGGLYIQSQLFISTDGGYTWKQKLDHLFGFSIIDHGGLLAATPLKYTIDHHVHYTTDYGKTWKQYLLTKLYSRVEAIITETTSKSMTVVVFGFLQKQPHGSQHPSNTWIVWKFNFTSIFVNGKCKKGDYSKFDHHNNKCVMGEKVNNRRRNADTPCINGPDFNSNIVATSCPCAYNDYHCSDGFYRHVTSLTPPGTYSCLRIGSSTVENICEEEQTTRAVTKGYYRVIGNKCSGGIQSSVEGTVEECPVTIPLLLPIYADATSAVNTDVLFKVKQLAGFYKTTYYWDFGDGKKETGPAETMYRVTHSFTRQGIYDVTLRAGNSAGNVTKTKKITIINDVYANAILVYEQPIIAHQDTEFSLQTVEVDGITRKINPRSIIKLIWSFGGIYIPGHKSEVLFSFSKTGMHKVEVQILIPHSYRNLEDTVDVFSNYCTVEISFSSLLDRSNLQTEAWIIDFKYKFEMFLLIKYRFIDKSRMFLKAKSEIPTKMFITFVDNEKTENTPQSAYIMAKKLADDINENVPVLRIYPMELDDIHMINAQLHGRPKKPSPVSSKHSSSSPAWIYVVVVLILLLLCAAVLGFYQYRRKGKLLFWKTHDVMKNKLVFDVDDDIVEMDYVREYADRENNE